MQAHPRQGRRRGSTKAGYPVLLKRQLSRNGGSQIIVALTWLLASLATAALAHVLIDIVGTFGGGGDAYDDHAHATVAPIGLAAVALIATLVWHSAARRIGRSQAIDPAMLLARRFGTMPLLVPVFTVAAGGFGALLAMEFTEQLSAFGRIEGVADALGGNAVVGLAIIVCVAAALTFGGLRSAAALLDISVSTVSALYAWIVVRDRIVIDTALSRRTIGNHRRIVANARLSQAHGLRAPPTIV
jgi:hypothetical protein